MPSRARQLVDEAFGEEAGVAVRRAAPIAGADADVGRDMIDRDIGDGIRRRRAGHRRARPGGPAGRVAPIRAATSALVAGAAIRARQPWIRPCAIQAVICAAAGGRKLSCSISWMRGQVSWTGRRNVVGDDRRLLDRVGFELAAIAAADQHRIERDLVLGQAERARGGGAGEARRLGRRPDFEPVAGQPRGRGQAARSAPTGRGRPRSGS